MVSLRQITEAHQPDSELIQQLATVFCAAREKHLRFLIDLHDVEEDRCFLSGVVLPANRVWVVEVAGRIVGFVAFANGWVNHLYIVPEFQRQRLGVQLLNIAKESNAVLQLWAFEVNTPAIQFYESQGFQVTKRTDGAGNEAKMPDVLMEWRDVRIPPDSEEPAPTASRC